MPARGWPGSELATTTAYRGRRREANNQLGLYIGYALEGDWAVTLTYQLPSLPPVEAFWTELPALFAWIEESRQPVIAAAYPLSPGDVVIRPPAGALSNPGMPSTAPIEVIRFSASNRLCVELDYVDEQGRRGVRIIELYSSFLITRS